VKTSSEEINRLVKQLGDDSSEKRLQARKQLEAIGEPAIGILKKAAESGDDLETRTVAKMIIEALDIKANGAMHVFEDHKRRVNGVAISFDGKRAISGSFDGMLRYWNLENKSLIRIVSGHNGAINGVALSPDGKRALSGGADRDVRLWDLEAGKVVRTFQGHLGQVFEVALSPDGKKGFSGSGDGRSRLWDLESGKELLDLETINGGSALAVAFTPDGKQAVTGGGNSRVKNNGIQVSLRLWDLSTGKEIRQFEGHTRDVRRVAVSPDSKQLLSGSYDGTMRLWDLQTGKELKKFDGPGQFVEAVSFTPDGKRAICCYGYPIGADIDNEDLRYSLRLLDLVTGRELRQFKGHDRSIHSLAISGDGRFLVSGSDDNSMRLWQLSK